MNVREKYWQDKFEERYRLFKLNKHQIKVRVVVIKDDKIVLLKIGDKNNLRYGVPGGSKDEGETQKQAIIREVLEEMNIVCKPIKYVCKEYSSRNTEYNGVKFISKRIEYYYIAKFDKYISNNKLGILGEFDNELTVEEIDFEEFKNIKKINFDKNIHNKMTLELKKHIKIS